MEELLQFFKDNKVSIQLTQELGKRPIVHGFFGFDFRELHKAEADTMVEALELLKFKMFELNE